MDRLTGDMNLILKLNGGDEIQALPVGGKFDRAEQLFIFMF